MDLFWKKVMPASITKYPWAGEMSKLKSVSAWEVSLKKKIAKMDNDEFNLFLAGVVMASGAAGMMGVDLTEKIQMFKKLRAE
jgi:hypothetical protein